MSALVVDGLRKRYRDHEAVAGIGFTVEQGEIVALLGPNGAGKTTTLEILEGFRSRDAGRVEVLGRDPGDRAEQRWLRERVGLVLQDIAVEPHLRVRETVARSAGYYPAPRDVDEVVELVGLAEKRDAKVKDLSGGQKRRLDLALGVIGDPKLLFLDEPTTGFDPTARRGAWEVVRSLRDLGTTVVLTTHYMDEAQALADQIVVLNAGRVVAQGTPETIGGRDTARTRIRFARPDGVAPEELPVVPTEIDETNVTLEVDDATEALHRLTGWALARGTSLHRLAVEQPTLEDVYLSLTGDAAGRPEAAPTSRRQRRRNRRAA
ncbi:ABC transporter ATP-binding protein [Micromonospora musae]|uniref:ABC transporter ATP-binding protein n=1 Tax=Micromonospora musae TaxID=1894970 RepID=A0A3A9Y9D2_9ACTN|nr:ABC transporter ATP-binding protein [Micromonospora musae]RKN33898.1 ABC transporter ATP-binding protein [Micromonospora musae]